MHRILGTAGGGVHIRSRAAHRVAGCKSQGATHQDDDCKLL